MPPANRISGKIRFDWHSVGAALVFVALVLIVASIYRKSHSVSDKKLFWYNGTGDLSDKKTADSSLIPTSIVPFIFLRDPSIRDTENAWKPIQQVLRSVIETYQKESSQVLSGLSRMLDEALISEEHVNKRVVMNARNKEKLLSAKIEKRIHHSDACLEHNKLILSKLLDNFSYVLALPDKSVDGATDRSSDKGHASIGNKRSDHFRHYNSSKIASESETHSYDSATQIWAHLVRDWTAEGQNIRDNIYGWCCDQLKIYTKDRTKVLVPGSGMGRLAYELFRLEYHVEANELSPSMAAAASAVLQNHLKGSFYPFVMDGMANEVDSERRFDKVWFPDVTIQGHYPGSLSYTVGNFVGKEDEYYRKQRVGHFDAVVTCFFIDTATNIYDYIETIQNLLRSQSSVWINVGPVQWHHNALLRPSVDELQELLEGLGWIIRSWSVDTKPISYRDDSSHPRMTSYDGYRPLRFVATRPK